MLLLLVMLVLLLLLLLVLLLLRPLVLSLQLLLKTLHVLKGCSAHTTTATGRTCTLRGLHCSSQVYVFNRNRPSSSQRACRTTTVEMTFPVHSPQHRWLSFLKRYVRVEHPTFFVKCGTQYTYPLRVFPLSTASHRNAVLLLARPGPRQLGGNTLNLRLETLCPMAVSLIRWIP